jgi:hypothetical protein
LQRQLLARYERLEGVFRQHLLDTGRECLPTRSSGRSDGISATGVVG